MIILLILSKPMRLRTACFLIVALLPSFPVVAQVTSTQNERNEMRRRQAEAITDDLLNDARQLTLLRRAELLTKIGHRWWLYDQRRAGIWIENGIDIVEEVPNQETSDERRQRLETARLMLKFVVALDGQKFSERLVTLLGNKDGSSDSERIENADGLTGAATTLGHFEPKRGAELGALALRLGPPTQVVALFNVLHRSDPKQAEDFLLQAIAAAKQDSQGLLLNSLTSIVFPTPRRFRNNNQPSSRPHKVRTMHVSEPYISPDNLRLELLQLDIAFLNAGFKGDGIDCASVFTVIRPVMDEFERLLPEQTPIARKAISECGFSNPVPQQPPQSSSKKRVFDTLALNTVEGLLEAAAEEKEPQARTIHKERAATLALTNKDYERTFQILDDMSPEERKSMGSWDQIRPHWAASAAWEHYKNGRIREMNLILDGVPSDLQALAEIEFMVNSLSITDPRPLERHLALQFLKHARAALRRSSLPEMKKYGWYFSLMRLLLKYDPPAAGPAFKEAVASLNRAEQMKENKDFKLLDYGGLARSLPLSLIEIDETVVKEGIAAIESVESRIQLRLEFLSETLQRTGPPAIP